MQNIFKSKTFNLFLPISYITCFSNVIMLPYFIKSGITPVQLALISSLNMYVFLGSDLISSYVFDNKSKRFSLLLSIIFTSVSFAFIGYALPPNFFYFLIISTVFQALGNAFLSGAYMSLTLEELDDKDNIKNDIANMNFYNTLCDILGGVTGYLLTYVVPVNYIFYFCGLSILLFCLPIMRYLPKNTFQQKINVRNIKRSIKYVWILYFAADRRLLTISSILVSSLIASISLFILFKIDLKVIFTVLILEYLLFNSIDLINHKLTALLKANHLMMISILLITMITGLLLVIHYEHFAMDSYIYNAIIIAISILLSTTGLFFKFSVNLVFQKRLSHKIRSTAMSYKSTLSGIVLGISYLLAAYFIKIFNIDYILILLAISTTLIITYLLVRHHRHFIN